MQFVNPFGQGIFWTVLLVVPTIGQLWAHMQLHLAASEACNRMVQ